ncbi:glycosyltransferase [Rhodopseudomonas palustris]|uniref:Glycosyltransferase n=1 Tax=Thiospirillum jenense TaxID=1653858 RepID=A0A839HGZ8_9GAMM|nr:glycosyltransferase [Thiospirillum jenense]MBB1093763.1 glycosyltransferase [Rhodopseudomonas palustris]MBB1127230.1 glycosyltransferase [Thiospirillum jenense]
MRIVVDLQACQSGSRLGGIGRYSLHLTEALAQLCAAHGQHELRIILNDLMPDSIPELYHIFSALIPRQQIQVFQVPGPIAENNPDNHTRARIAEVIREHYIQRLAPDIIHIASLIEGLSDNVVSSVDALPSKAGLERTVVTLYDLIPLVDKERYLQNPLVQTHYYRKLDALKRAGGLLAISEFSRQQGIDVLGIAPDRIINIAAGVDPRFQPLTIPNEQAAQLRQRYGLNGGIVLYTSSFDQRKNQARLIQAFAQLPAPLLNQYQLVIVGNGWEGIYNELYQVATRAGLNRKQVIFTGRITDADLLALYNLTDVFVFPSLSEGYGLPVLEAMACGIPTIASNTTSIPEVVGRDDALFDPFDISSINAKLHQALTDHGFRNELREHGLIQSRQFTWKASATRALEFLTEQYARTVTFSRASVLEIDKHAFKTLRQMCKDNQVGTAETIRVAAAVAANMKCLINCSPSIPRIGWITTWNTRCGIAMYSRYLTGAHRQDYTIFAPYEPQPALPDESNVVRCWHIGRDDLRSLAEQIHLQGITTLVIQFNYGLFDFYSLNQFLREMIATGRRVFITLHATTDTVEKQLSQLSEPLALCDAIFVHSKKDETELNKIGLNQRTQLFPHGVPDIPITPVKSPIPSGRFVIASYGFFLPHKGLFELIEVCQILITQYKLDIHLLMINAEYPVDISAALIAEAKQRIAKHQLQERVTLVTDFLDDAVSLGWLHDADLICYPYQQTGESSSAAVRMGLAAQRPVVVTPLTIFDDVNSVVLQLPGTSIKEIAKGIAELNGRLRHPDVALQTIQAAAKQWVIAHGYSTLAEKFWQRLGGKS